MAEFLPSDQLELSGFARIGLAAAIAVTALQGLQPVSHEAQEQHVTAGQEACPSARQYDPQFADSARPLEQIVSNPAKLPVITESRESKIASVVGSSKGPELNVSALPFAFQDALHKSLEDPYLTCTVMGGTALSIVTTDGFDSASHGHGGSKFSLSTARLSPEQKLFTTVEQVHFIWTHENTHGEFAKWTESKDPQAKEALERLTNLYRQEYKLVLEDFRKSYGPQMVEQLQSFKSRFDAQDLPKISGAIEALVQRFGREHGLDAIAFAGMGGQKEAWQIARADVEELITNASAVTGDPIYQLDFSDTEYKQQAKEINEFLRSFMETSFPDADESSTLSRYSAGGGHPYDNPNEDMSSRVTSLRHAYTKAIAAARKYPAERRKIVVDKYKIIHSLYRHNQPELLQWIPLTQAIRELEHR